MPGPNDPPRNRDRDDDYDDDRPRRGRDRDDDDDDDDRRRRRREPGSASNGLATAGLILGILSLCTGPLAGIPALICAGIALGRPGGRGTAIGGLVTGGIGTLIMPLIAYGLMLPAFDKVRGAASRMQDANNLKQLALGQHSAHDAQGGMSQYARDDRGQVSTGLSFRVELLPMLGQQNLYRRFDHREPWDGATNRAASNTPIREYTAPFDGKEPSTNTPYRVFVGGGALFEENGRSVSLTQITDGTSNTILAVHATEQVPWAEPRELKYDPNGPLPKLGHPKFSDGFSVAMADGSVRFITKTVSERTLRAAITKNGNELLGADW